MCNWCTNKITIKGANIKDKLAKHFVDREDGGDSMFDFNTVIKMPEELSIKKSSRSHDGFLLYLSSINPLINNIGSKEDKYSMKEFGELLLHHYPDVINNIPKYILKPTEIEELKNKYKDTLKEVIKLGKQVVFNQIHYGSSDWYDWSIEHWGTKWNSCNTWHNEDYTEIYFDTAWSPSLPIVAALAKLYPELEITHEWAEEQTGWYSGKYTYRDGELVEALDYESYSKEAYELSFELWGNEEQYRFNEETNNYEYIDEDE